MKQIIIQKERKKKDTQILNVWFANKLANNWKSICYIFGETYVY